MQLISPNYPWKNGVKQIKINQTKLPQSCIFHPIAKDPHRSNEAKNGYKYNFCGVLQIFVINWVDLI